MVKGDLCGLVGRYADPRIAGLGLKAPTGRFMACGHPRRAVRSRRGSAANAMQASRCEPGDPIGRLFVSVSSLACSKRSETREKGESDNCKGVVREK